MVRLLDGEFVTNLCYTGRPTLKKKSHWMRVMVMVESVPTVMLRLQSRSRESDEAAMDRAGLTVLTCWQL